MSKQPETIGTRTEEVKFSSLIGKVGQLGKKWVESHPVMFSSLIGKVQRQLLRQYGLCLLVFIPYR